LSRELNQAILDGLNAIRKAKGTYLGALELFKLILTNKSLLSQQILSAFSITP
jgi:hypothetical protein